MTLFGLRKKWAERTTARLRLRTREKERERERERMRLGTLSLTRAQTGAGAGSSSRSGLGVGVGVGLGFGVGKRTNRVRTKERRNGFITCCSSTVVRSGNRNSTRSISASASTSTSTSIGIASKQSTTTSSSSSTSSSKSRFLASASLVGVSIGVGCNYYYYYYLDGDEGTRRAMEFYKTFVPVVLHYRFVETRWSMSQYFSNSLPEFVLPVFHNLFPSFFSPPDWEALDELYAVPTVAKLGELQGMYCKYGQTAAGFTNTFGDAWIRQFRKLENKVPPRKIQDVYKTITEETHGKKIHETFQHFEETPLGSASIGQVHRAILHPKLISDSTSKHPNLKQLQGTQVAVKVQYAEAQQLFQQDIHAIRTFTTIFAPEHVVLLDAIEKQNAAELDYTNEASNLIMVANNMKKHRFQPQLVVIPAPIPHLSTHRMLVMELLPGPKLIDGIRNYLDEWAKQHGTTLQQLESQLKRQHLQLLDINQSQNENQDETLNSDNNDKESITTLTGQQKNVRIPSFFQISMYRKYLLIKDASVNLAIATYNGIFASWIPNVRKIPYQKSMLPPDIPRIIDTLMVVHGYQLLKDGLFNADPHGGNFILLPDGRIGMIDYGATKKLTRNERLTMCLIYAALARNDQDRLWDLCQVGGYKSKYGRRDVLMKLIQFGYDSWDKDVIGQQNNIQQFIDDLKQKDPWEEVPDNFTMTKLMNIRLRALAMGMNYPVKCSRWWGPIAEETLKEEGLPYDEWTYDMLVQYKPDINLQKFKFA